MNTPSPNAADQAAAAIALLKRIRYHAQRHALPRDWLTAADEVLGTWEPVKLDHRELAPEVAAAARRQALEDAARVCEAQHHNWRWDDEPNSDSGPRACAAAIRGLMDKA